MKTKILVAVLICFMGALFHSCENAKGDTRTEVATIDKEAIRAEISAMENTYADAVNMGNADQAAAYYAEDATSYHQNEPPVVGKQAIKESLAKEIALLPKGSRINFITEDIMVSSDGNQVVETGRYTLSDATNPEALSGNFISIFEKRDGKYVCVKDMSVSDQMAKP